MTFCNIYSICLFIPIIELLLVLIIEGSYDVIDVTSEINIGVRLYLILLLIFFILLDFISCKFFKQSLSIELINALSRSSNNT